MSKSKPKDPTQGVCLGPLVARASLRKLRLHACGCVRLNLPARASRRWLDFITVAECYADGEIAADDLLASEEHAIKGRSPGAVDGDLGFAMSPDEYLHLRWRSVRRHYRYKPKHPDYHLVLSRYRVLDDLVGPKVLPMFDPAWRSDTAVSLAKHIYDSRDFSAMPILADALQDAGCEHADILTHCRGDGPHVRGCWVVDLVLDKS